MKKIVFHRPFAWMTYGFIAALAFGVVAHADDPKSAKDFRPEIEARVKVLEEKLAELETKIQKLKTDSSAEGARKLAEFRNQNADAFEEYAVAKAVVSTYRLVEEPITHETIQQRMSELTSEIAKLEGKKTRTVASGDINEQLRNRQSERAFWTGLQQNSKP